MARKLEIVLVIVCCALLLMAFIPQTTLIEQPAFIETKNIMVFGDSGQGIKPNFNTGEMELITNA